jgi:hypothetical protein
MPGLMGAVPVPALAFAGDFEIHVTIAIPSAHGIGELSVFAAGRDIKFAHIVLDRGSTPSQPMLTMPGHGTLAAQVAAAGSLSRDLAGAGFTVARVKVEAAPWNGGIPADDSAAARLGDAMYFEHHLKVVLDGDPGDGSLAALVGRFGARLSRNARRHRADGKAEWFATQRCYRVGLLAAGVRLAALISALTNAGHAPVEVEREFVVFDNAPSVDDGWLEQRELAR